MNPCPHAADHPLMSSCGCGYKAKHRAFPNEEPAAELRQFAATLRGMYVALIHEGFTAQEALVIIGQVLTSQLGGGK